MKIQNKRIKQKMKTKSQELKAKAKIKSEEFRVKSKEISERFRAKNEEHKAQQKQLRQNKIPQNQDPVVKPLSEPTKYCSECGVQVTISGSFCPGCGAIH